MSPKASAVPDDDVEDVDDTGDNGDGDIDETHEMDLSMLSVDSLMTSPSLGYGFVLALRLSASGFS